LTYHFYGYVNQDTPAQITSDLTQISQAAFSEANISIEIIDADRQKDNPAIKYLDLWPAQSFPAAVLVSPDGQSLPVPVTSSNEPFEQTLRAALRGIVSSPAREELLRHVSNDHGVVLLIEGTNAEENTSARKAASGAIEKIGVEMKMMPESMGQPPVLTVVGRESFSRERILLWSLGLAADKISETYAAVIYGKMRWLGPLMKGEKISEDNLTDILSVIGAECECRFDISWTQGTMLPTQWDGKMRARVAKALGFDPENPMVKMEVSSILKTPYSYSGVPFGYTELTVESKSPSEMKEIPVEKAQTEISPGPSSGAMVSEETVPAKRNYVLRKPLYIIGGMAILIIIAGTFLLFSRARINS